MAEFKKEYKAERKVVLELSQKEVDTIRTALLTYPSEIAEILGLEILGYTETENLQDFFREVSEGLL